MFWQFGYAATKEVCGLIAATVDANYDDNQHIVDCT